MLNTMTTVYDVPPDRLIEAAKQELKKIKDIAPPEWSQFVKTGAHRERPPVDPDWWWTRCAAILRTTYVRGPIGVTRLRTKYGGRRNCGSKPEKFRRGSGKVIRVCLQQLETAGLIKKQSTQGRVVTAKGRSLLDKLSAKLAR
jgi:small subunit ribosomal protein S19e